MYLGLIEARYDYQMSYLDQWAKAWRGAATKVENFNIVRKEEHESLLRKANQFDLLVALHSVTADSNYWLERLSRLSHTSRSPLILFVGNEFSSPFLSTETRLKNISDVAPEIIATQIPVESARWLYESTGSLVVAAPPGLPDITFPAEQASRKIDLGYRGFPYPWYLLDEDRNSTTKEVSDLFKSLDKKVDISYTQRFNSNEWFEFLQNSFFTASSEAGSRYVFRDDAIWQPVQEYFSTHHKFSAVKNDAVGMTLLRQLPAPLKRFLKRITNAAGVNQASLYQPSSQEIKQLKALIDPSRFEFRDGKAISSRHFDAIACGTWQLLKPGSYNDILEPEVHYSPWEPTNFSVISELIANPNMAREKAREALENLKSSQTYRIRVDGLLRALG